MVKRYNPPPGWLVPGEGWRPSFDWRPDPAWPPAPVDWNFWVDHEQGPAPAVAASPRGRRFRRGYLGAAVVVSLIGVGVLTGVLSSSAGQQGSVTFAAASSASPTETAQPSSTPSEITTTSPAPRVTAVVKAAAAAAVSAQPTSRTYTRQLYTRPLASRRVIRHTSKPAPTTTTHRPTPTKTTSPSSPAPTTPSSCDPGPPRLGRLGELLPAVCSGLAGRPWSIIPPR